MDQEQKPKARPKWYTLGKRTFNYFLLLLLVLAFTIGPAGRAIEKRWPEFYARNADWFETDIKAYDEVCEQATVSETPYRELFRNIEHYEGNVYIFTGEVMQSIPHTGRLHDYLINITYWESGNWRDIIYVSSDPMTLTGSRILERDILVFCGKPVGIAQYESVRGETVEVPEIAMLVAYAVHDVSP